MSDERNDAPRKRGRPRRLPQDPGKTGKDHPLGPGHIMVELDCDDTGCGQLVCLSEKWWHVHIQKIGLMWRLLSRREVTLQEAVQLTVAYHKRMPEAPCPPEDEEPGETKP